jgi:hypothetical protein
MVYLVRITSRAERDFASLYQDIHAFDPSAWISRAKAAQLRGVSRQAIAELVRKKSLQNAKK